MLARYYQKTKKKAREMYKNIFEEEKYKKRRHAREPYRNLSEEEKEKKRQ